MSTVVERFLAGEDGLARLLSALPAFEPPAGMAERFAAQARQSQQALDAPMAFAPPPGMEQAFRAEAARIQAVQQPRRDAVIAELQSGKSAASVLGHNVNTATAEWLANQASTTPQPLQRSRWRIWWPRVGAVLASTLMGILVTQIWLAQRQEPDIAAALGEPPLQSSAPQPEIKVAESTSTADKSPAPALQGQVESRPTSRAAERKAEAVLAKRAAEAAPMLRMELAERQPEPAEAEEQKIKLADNDMQSRPASPASIKLEGEAPAKPPPPATTAAEADKLPALKSVDAAVSPSSPPPAMPAAVEDKAPAPSAHRKAAALPVMPAKKMKQDQADGLRQSYAPMPALHVTLENSPEEIVARWQAIQADRTPRIYSSNPTADAVLDWVERFRLALPAGIRPEKLDVSHDSQMESNTLRLE